MRRVMLLPLGLGLTLFSCSSPEGSHTDGSDSIDPKGHAAEQHAHGSGHSHANEYMNQSEFDELVDRFENADREAWQQPSKVMDYLGPLKGKTVADLGAGTGYFSVRLAERGAKVIALDIDERFLDYIGHRKDSLASVVGERIEVRQCEENSSNLKPEEVDMVFSVNTYHHISERPAYFRKLHESLKPGGRLVIVDFRSGDLPVGPPADHKVSLEQMKKELAEAGYTQITADEHLLEYQFVLEAK